jgi:hypothetical protein
MLFWLAAAASASADTAAAPQSTPTVRPVAAEARAMVRIISGVRLKLGPAQIDQNQSGDVPPPHNTRVVADGAARPAKLIEFE